MDVSNIPASQLPVRPSSFPWVPNAAPQASERAAAAAETNTNRVLLSALAQALGTTPNTGDSSSDVFLSAMRASQAAPSLLKASSPLDVSQTPVAQELDSPASLFIQAVRADALANASEEYPFTAPYQLGLQANQELTSLTQTPSQTEVAASSPAQNLTSTLNPLTGTAEIVNVGIQNPTLSPLFQAHLGALAPNSLATPLSLGAGLPETPADFGVTGTYASTAAHAFTEGQPFTASDYAPSSPLPTRRSPSPSTRVIPTAGAAVVYSFQGLPYVNGLQTGKLVDFQG